jgi:nickel-dependent lactate racemase
MRNENKKQEQNMTPAQAQDKRRQGYYVLMSRNLKKVIAISKNESEIISLLNTKKYSKMFGPLKNVVITKDDVARYEKLHEIIWNNSTFGEVK